MVLMNATPENKDRGVRAGAGSSSDDEPGVERSKAMAWSIGGDGPRRLPA
jgi:hypothetical protein